MAKRPEAPAGSVSMWTGSALVYFDGRDLVINRTGGSIKGVSTYAVNQISGIQITKPALSLWVMRILTAGESGPVTRRRQGMIELTRDPFVVQFNGKHKAEAEAIAQAVRDAQAGLRAPVVPAQPQPATAGLGEQIQQLAQLHAQGALSDAEFAAARARLLAQPGAPQDQAPRAW